MSASQSDLAGVIVTASVAIFVAVFTAVAGKLYEQHLKIRDELRAKKAPMYEAHIATFFKVLFGPKTTGKAPDQKEMVAAFAAFSEKMIVWGSADVIKAWNDFKASAQSATPGRDTIDRLGGVFMAIRKDLGNDDRELKKEDLLRLVVNDAPGCPPTTKGEKCPV